MKVPYVTFDDLATTECNRNNTGARFCHELNSSLGVRYTLLNTLTPLQEHYLTCACHDIPQDETKELTKPDADADGHSPAPPAKKEGEVVYAELVLNSDGVKTEVRPSADKTEYAVIVGTKPEAEADAEDNKNKE